MTGLSEWPGWNSVLPGFVKPLSPDTFVAPRPRHFVIVGRNSGGGVLSPRSTLDH